MPPVHGLQVAQGGQDLADGFKEPGDGARACLDTLLEPFGGDQGLGPPAADAGVLLPVRAGVAGVVAQLVAQRLNLAHVGVGPVVRLPPCPGAPSTAPVLGQVA